MSHKKHNRHSYSSLDHDAQGACNGGLLGSFARLDDRRAQRAPTVRHIEAPRITSLDSSGLLPAWS
jgi:hypothetical protein